MDEDEPGELVDGRLEQEVVPDLIHELVVAWLIQTLGNWLGEAGFVFGSGGRARAARHRGGGRFALAARRAARSHREDGRVRDVRRFLVLDRRSDPAVAGDLRADRRSLRACRARNGGPAGGRSGLHRVATRPGRNLGQGPATRRSARSLKPESRTRNVRLDILLRRTYYYVQRST